MRHQLTNVEHVYSPWMKIYQNKSAVNDMITLRQWPQNPLTEKNNGFTIEHLRPPHQELKLCLSNLLATHFTGLSTPTVFGLKDASTQTTDPEMEKDEQLELTSQPSDILPVCVKCKNGFQVYGPVGLTRHKRYGHYFRQCGRCDGGAPCSGSQWYSLGILPPIASSSTKPRNLEAIQAYIQLKTSSLDQLAVGVG